MVDMFDVMLSLIQQQFKKPSETMQMTVQLKQQLTELGVFEVPKEGADIMSFGTSRPDSLRIFMPDEIEKITSQCRGFILFLHRAQILTEKQREVVIENLMQLPQEQVGVEQLMPAVAVQLIFEPEKLYALVMVQQLLQAQSVGLH